MALITETGAGLPDAESYCTVAFADAHNAARGATAWAALTTEQKEQRLRLATEYMVQEYRLKWAGWRATATQALDWPRAYVPRRDVGDYYASNIVPLEAQRACAELANRVVPGVRLLADQGREVMEQTVGPITTKYAQGSGQATRYAGVDALLGPLLLAERGGSTMRLVRA